jgi:hypothetical protein
LAGPSVKQERVQAILLSRSLTAKGEVVSQIPLDEWRTKASAFGIDVTDILFIQNPFTHQATEKTLPGAGLWSSPTGTHTVLFECGAVLVRDCDAEERTMLAPLASTLSANLSDARPFFACERLTLSALLRRATRQLPTSSSCFCASEDFNPETPCLLLIPGSTVDAELSLASDLGFPFGLLPNDVLEQVAESVQDLQVPPSDRLLVDAFKHYLEHDSFLPSAC